MTEANALANQLGEFGSPAIEFTSAADLCLKQSLYAKVNIADSDYIALRGGRFQYDGYCKHCDKEAVFKANRVGYIQSMQEVWSKPSKFSLVMQCTRSGHIVEYYFFYLGQNKIVKIGQYPSIEDLAGNDLNRFKPFLKDGFFQELIKANGLYSHGIGIGSFVYLRRIFEKLIEDHRVEFERSNGEIEDFHKKKMAEKIEVLSSNLPPALVKNRAIYGILSSGIHELSEDDCKLYYPVVKASIIQILEQDYEAKEKMKAQSQLEAEVARIQQALTKRPKAS